MLMAGNIKKSLRDCGLKKKERIVETMSRGTEIEDAV